MKFKHPDLEYDIAGNPVYKDGEGPRGKNFEKSAPHEKTVFAFLWRTRPHVSFVSGEPVEDIPTTFAHVLPKAKNRFPRFKLLGMNIVFLTPDEHHLWDNQRYKIEEDPHLREKWKGMFELEEHLLWLHDVMFPDE